MKENFSAGVQKRADGWCELVSRALDSIPEFPMKNRDGFRPIQRTKVGY